MKIFSHQYPEAASFVSAMENLVWRVVSDLNMLDTSIVYDREDCMQEGRIALISEYDKLHRRGSLMLSDIYLDLKHHLWRYRCSLHELTVPVQISVKDLDHCTQCHLVDENIKYELIRRKSREKAQDDMDEVVDIAVFRTALEPHEQAVLGAILQGWNYRDIAENLLGCTAAMVSKIVKSIRKKYEDYSCSENVEKMISCG